MIKRSPQEIADFFGCEVQVHPYTNSVNLWAPNGDIKEGLGYLNHKLIHMSNTADDKLTYEPREKQENSGNKDGSYYQDSENSDNKHQCEVYTHFEYTVEHSYQLNPLISRIKCLMNDGWKPQGGIAVEHLLKSEGYADGACYYYQAMVRGV